MVPAMVRTAPDPTPYFLSRLERRLAQLGMRSQPEVIVRGKIDDLLAVKRAHRLLLVFKHAQLEVRALFFELANLFAKDRKEDRRGLQ